MKPIISISVVAMFIVMATASFVAQAADPTSGIVPSWALRYAADKAITLQLNWKHQFESAAFYAAIEQGYYRGAGLDVTIREGGPGVDPLGEVVSGRTNFGIANSSLVLEHARGKPVIALAAMMQHSAFALVARRDRGINTVEDLDGKRVSCAVHACDEIRAYLRASGLHDGRIRYMPLTSTDIDENLRSTCAMSQA